MIDRSKGPARGAISVALVAAVMAGCVIRDSGGPPGEIRQMEPGASEFRRRFTADFATAVESGQPILRSLNQIAAHEPEERFRAIVTDVAADIEAGGTLSDALVRHPAVFDADYVEAIRTGERTGTLDLVLRKMADTPM